MTGKNEITGDTLISKTNTKEYNENYDKIFKKCEHDFKYDGHGHNYSVYKCTRCGKEEER